MQPLANQKKISWRIISVHVDESKLEWITASLPGICKLTLYGQLLLKCNPPHFIASTKNRQT